MKRPIRISGSILGTLIVLMSASWFATAPPAQAAYTSSVGSGVLTLTGTSGIDTATVTCDVGQVKIDAADPSTGAVNCNTITAVVVDGQGGADSVFLDSMTAGVFPALTTQTVSGGDDFDQLITAPVPGTIDGGAGDDRIYQQAGNQTIIGGIGTDTVYDLATVGATATDTSLVTSSGGTDSLSSVEGVFLTGTNASEVFNLAAFSGRTDVNAGYGNDTVEGGSGTDFVIAGGDQDVVNGNGGDDTIVPNDGDDTVDGGPGTDTILLGDDGFTVTDQSASGPFIGSDTLGGFERATLLMFSGATLNASGFSGKSTVTGSPGNDTLITGPGGDSISAGDGADTIRSGGGNDTLRGEAGKDLLIAGAGNDHLFGGPAHDDCRGGSGNNTFNSCP